MVRRGTVAIGVLVAVLAIVPGVSSAQATPSATTNGASGDTRVLAGNHIINRNSGKCLVARDSAPGTGAVQTPCASFADQNWVLVSEIGGWWQIKNAYTNLCLRAPGGIEQQIRDASCDISSGIGVDWSIDAIGGGYSRIFSRSTGGCLVVRGTANEAAVVTTGCNTGFIDQHWYLPG